MPGDRAGSALANADSRRPFDTVGSRLPVKTMPAFRMRVVAFAMAGKRAAKVAHHARIAWMAPLGVALCVVVSPTNALASTTPVIEGESVSQIAEHGARLSAEIDPEGLETKYEFWIQYAACQSDPANGPCEAIVVTQVGEGRLAAGYTGSSVSVALSALKPGFTYTYFVVAVNDAGVAKGPSRQFRAEAGTPTSGEDPVPPPEDEAPGTPNNYATPYESSAYNSIGGIEQASAEELTADRAAAIAQRRAEETAEQAAAEARGEEREAAEHASAPAAVAQCQVPSLRGDSLAAARAALSRGHCALGMARMPRGSREHLVVTRQSRRPGSKLRGGANVTVTLGARRPAHP